MHLKLKAFGLRKVTHKLLKISKKLVYSTYHFRGKVKMQYLTDFPEKFHWFPVKFLNFLWWRRGYCCSVSLELCLVYLKKKTCLTSSFTHNRYDSKIDIWDCCLSQRKMSFYFAIFFSRKLLTVRSYDNSSSHQIGFLFSFFFFSKTVNIFLGKCNRWKQRTSIFQKASLAILPLGDSHNFLV